jgi:hypothetical protein
MSLVALSAPRSAYQLSARAILAEARRRQPLFFGMAVVMLALIPPTAAAYLLDDRLLNGINVWSKPLKFEVSLAPFFATLAWFWAYLPAERQHGRVLNAYAVVTATLVFLEVAYMIIRSGRGVGSHFNESTPVEAILFTLMGIAAIVFMVFPLILGIVLARGGETGLAPAFRLSVILGLMLTFLLGGTAGIAAAQNGGHWVGAPATDAGGFPIFGWTRAGGDLRVAHFFGIHAMQILPIAGGLSARRRPSATGLVWLAAAGLTAFTAYTLMQALAGEPFLGFIG